MSQKKEKRSKISENFSSSTEYYHHNAGLQKRVAERLANALEPWRYTIVDGPILEIGAGTGFFTKHLTKLFTNERLIVSDISNQMIERCRVEVGKDKGISYRRLDAENFEFQKMKYALIAGNFVAQWFTYPGQTLLKMVEALKPGGLLLVSFPGSKSFSNWKSYCLDLGLPFTGNKLPDVEQVVIELSTGPVQVDFYEDTMTDRFDSVFEFFKHMKSKGAGTNMTGKKLTFKQLKLLNEYWLEKEQGKVEVHYHTAFIAAKRDPES
jgi:malonyl-CoA O-methyltransferase